MNMTTPTNIYPDCFFQHTLSDAMTFVGRGLHTDIRVVMRIIPAEPNSGIVFVRRDIDSHRSEVSALWHNVINTHLSTTLGNASGVRVSTVEHLMAALYACGVDNARIILDGPEIPILDGSALPYMSVFRNIGTIAQTELRRAILIKEQISVYDGESHASLSPATIPWIDVEIDYASTAIGKQRLSVPIDQDIFHYDLAPARTFGFSEQIGTLRSLGYTRGGSLHNAILIKDGLVLNDGGLRYPDEFVRHKTLDCIGDLALAGARIIGKFHATRPGHRVNNALLRELMLNRDRWQYTTLVKAQAAAARIGGNDNQGYGNSLELNDEFSAHSLNQAD